TLLACTVPAHADGTAAAQYKSGTLTVDVSGVDVSMQLRLPMTRGDTSGNKQTLTTAETVARLKEATKLFVFPDQARCQVENANAFAVDTQGKPTTAEGNIQAMYRFHCDGATSARIDKLGIRLSDQLPGLEKLKLQVATEKGEIARELSPANGDVTLWPAGENQISLGFLLRDGCGRDPSWRDFTGQRIYQGGIYQCP
ncbi:MAG: DUF2796 domain-containing protein, partial [Betaproteobacteria bacterium]